MASFPTADHIRGGNTQIGFVVESTYNDGVTTSDPVAWFAPISTTVAVVPENTIVPDMGLDASGLPALSYLSKQHVAGDIVTRFSLDDDGMLLRAAWGSTATTGTGAPYTHTHTLTLDNPASLGGVLIVENTAGTTYELEMAGIQVSQWVMELSAGGIVQNTYSIFGNVDTAWGSATQTRAAPVPAAADIALSKQSGAISWNSNTYKVISARFVIERQTSPDLQYASEVGVSEAHATSNLMCYCEAEFPQSDFALLAAQVAGTSSDLSLVITNGSKTATITLEDAVVMGHTPSGDGIGPRNITVRWEARAGGTFGAKLVIVNAESSAVNTQNTAA